MPKRKRASRKKPVRKAPRKRYARKAPNLRAREHIGEQQVGLDGNKYIAKKYPSGAVRWVKVKAQPIKPALNKWEQLLKNRSLCMSKGQKFLRMGDMNEKGFPRYAFALPIMDEKVNDTVMKDYMKRGPRLEPAYIIYTVKHEDCNMLPIEPATVRALAELKVPGFKVGYDQWADYTVPFVLREDDNQIVRQSYFEYDGRMSKALCAMGYSGYSAPSLAKFHEESMLCKASSFTVKKYPVFLTGKTDAQVFNINKKMPKFLKYRYLEPNMFQKAGTYELFYQ